MDTVLSNASPSITASALAARLGLQGAPVVIDVRKTPAFDSALRVVAGALRIPPESLESGSASLPREPEIVVYCVHGHEVSQGAALTLRQAGFNAAFLEGGIGHWQ